MKKQMIFAVFTLLLPVLMFAENSRLNSLKDRSEGLIPRQVAAKMLIKDRVPEVGPVLAQIVKNPKEDGKMRLFCMKSLGEMEYRPLGPTPAEIKQLFVDMGDGILVRDDKSFSLSKAYLEILGSSKFKDDPEVLVVLGQFVGKADKEDLKIKEDLKLKAMDVLGASSSKDTLTLLMITLSDKKPEIRKKALLLISKQAQGDAVTLFISKLEEETDDDVRAVYAEELNKLPIPKIRSSWIADLKYWATEEPVESIKLNLNAALARVKEANPGKGLAGPNISVPRRPRPVVPKPIEKKK